MIPKACHQRVSGLVTKLGKNFFPKNKKNSLNCSYFEVQISANPCKAKDSRNKKNFAQGVDKEKNSGYISKCAVERNRLEAPRT